MMLLKKIALFSAALTCFASFAMATDSSPIEDNETQEETTTESPMQLDDNFLDTKANKACQNAGRV